MVNFKRAMSNNRIMLALTGFKVDQFMKIAQEFGAQYNQTKREEYLKEDHLRQIGGGKKPKLKTPEEKLFFILLYFKCYPTFDLLSYLFDLDRGPCCRWVHRLKKILEAVLKKKLVLPERKISSVAEFVQCFPEATKVFIDGFERPRRRPKNPEDQKKYYSGKKKRHTIKNVIITDEDRKVKVISKTYEGKKHDFAICKEEEMPKFIPKSVDLFLDLGFEGIEKNYSHLNVFKPLKKPKGKEICELDKKLNRLISSVRVKVEHTISGIKRFRIVSDVFRNTMKGFDDCVSLLSAGLWNYYLVN